MRARLSSLIALLSLTALTAPTYEEGTQVKFTREGMIVAYVKTNWIRLDRNTAVCTRELAAQNG